MANNFRKQLTDNAPGTNVRGNIYINKAAPPNGVGTTPETAFNHPVQAAPYLNQGSTNFFRNQPGGGLTYMDGSCNCFIGAGHYQGECAVGFPHRLIADGKVVWYVNGNLYMGTKSDQLNGIKDVKGIVFRFIDHARFGNTGGGFDSWGTTYVTDCTLEYNSNADINTYYFGSATLLAYDGNATNLFTNCILKKFHGGTHGFVTSLVFNSLLLDCRRFTKSYADPASFIEMQNVAVLSNLNYFGNCNIQGQIRVKGDSYGYTDLATFKVNYGLTGRLDLVNRDPRFNKAISDDFTLKIDSPHLDLQIGPTTLRYALMYFVDTTASAGDPCTIGNTRLKSTADNSLIPFRSLNGFTINASGGLVIAANSAGNFEADYVTARIPIAATSQRVKRLPVISGLNFDTDYPAAASGFNSVSPEVFNNNVPDYSNSTSGNAARSPNRLTVQARFSTLANPDENDPSHWTPNNGNYYDFEIDEEPLYDIVAGLGSGHANFDQASINVRPVIAKFAQFRFKARNDYFSR